jgi:hypothetical protein
MKNFKELSNQLREQDDTTEKTEMAATQAHFIQYAAEEILEYIEMGGEIEEWYQNKLSKVHSDMEGLHSWMEGEKRRTGMVKEEQIGEVSSEMLSRYKKKASEQATVADKEGDYKKGDKRYSGIIKATNKQFVNDMKKHQKEEVESLEEKNVPTSPEKWAQAKAQAKAKFDVYPSAYANGWAAKKYKEMGGGWKSVSEEVEQIDEVMAQPDYSQSIKARQAAADKKKKDDNLPFTPDKPRKQNVVAGKHGVGYSTARHLARMAMQKQIDKTKKPIKEEEMSKKAQIVKKIAKKKESGDTFNAEPVLSTTITKNN